MGNASVMVGDIGQAKDGGQLQTNIVRVDGQHSVYTPVLKQGGNSNTISIVAGMKTATEHLLDIPSVLKTNVVFDQATSVKIAVRNVINEGTIGLCLNRLDDPVVSGQREGNARRSHSNSDFRPRDLPWFEPRWQHDQDDGAGWTRPGFIQAY